MLMLKREAQEVRNTGPFVAPSLFPKHLKTFKNGHDLLRKVNRLGKTSISKMFIK